jgi:membrane associated rhomboid family serine protease
MLGDRFYMRESADYNRSSAMIIFWSLVVIFILQGVDGFYNPVDPTQREALRGHIFQHLGLSLDGIRHGYVWQLITFQFMHAGVFHLVFNLFSLFFFGKALEETLGTRRFLQVYFGAGIAGGVLQIVCTWLFCAWHFYPAKYAMVDTVGASAGIMGVIALYALINPYQVITIWGIFPIRAMWYLVAAGLISFYFTIIPVGAAAHAAHLGGILFGIAYSKWFMHSDWSFPKLRLRFRQNPKPQELVTTPASGGGFWKKTKLIPPEEEIPSGDFISKEVDPILDKIHAHGMQSLTDRERRILEAARAKMSRR